MPNSPYLELLDWRRQVAQLFADLRSRPPNADTLAWFRAQKDRLFKDHPQSPIPLAERVQLTGLAYWPFDASRRVEAQFTPTDEVEQADEPPQPPAAEGEVAFKRIGHLTFELDRTPLSLDAFWIAGYAGGLFVPFTDATSRHETYGGGRYLLDTIKSADLGPGAASETVVLDFNYAYHPSCVYDPIWVCPLAPPDSRLTLPIRAGERLR